MTTRAATEADLIAFYGSLPPVTTQAWVGIADGEVFGVLGLARDADTLVFFSDYKPEAKQHLKRMTVLKLIRSMRDIIRKRGVPVIALADEREPDSAKLLTRLGFEFIEQTEGGGLYRWRS